MDGPQILASPQQASSILEHGPFLRTGKRNSQEQWKQTIITWISGNQQQVTLFKAMPSNKLDNLRGSGPFPTQLRRRHRFGFCWRLAPQSLIVRLPAKPSMSSTLLIPTHPGFESTKPTPSGTNVNSLPDLDPKFIQLHELTFFRSWTRADFFSKGLRTSVCGLVAPLYRPSYIKVTVLSICEWPTWVTWFNPTPVPALHSTPPLQSLVRPGPAHLPARGLLYYRLRIGNDGPTHWHRNNYPKTLSFSPTIVQWGVAADALCLHLCGHRQQGISGKVVSLEACLVGKLVPWQAAVMFCLKARRMSSHLCRASTAFLHVHDHVQSTIMTWRESGSKQAIPFTCRNTWSQGLTVQHRWSRSE